MTSPRNNAESSGASAVEPRSIAARTRFDATARGAPGATSPTQSTRSSPTTCCHATRVARSGDSSTRSPWTRTRSPPRHVRTRICPARPRANTSKRSPSTSTMTRVARISGCGSSIRRTHPSNSPTASGASSSQAASARRADVTHTSRITATTGHAGDRDRPSSPITSGGQGDAEHQRQRPSRRASAADRGDGDGHDGTRRKAAATARERRDRRLPGSS